MIFTATLLNLLLLALNTSFTEDLPSPRLEGNTVDNTEFEIKQEVICTEDTLSSQAEVDAFNCTTFGTLTISGNDIENLDNLSTLTIVGGLVIKDNPNLKDLNGLQNISDVHMLAIGHNPALDNLNGLERIEKIDELYITNNDNLIDISGLSSLKNAFAVGIGGNDRLTNIDGLSGLKEMIGGESSRISISDNRALTDLSGLRSLEYTGFLTIDNNDALVDLNGFTNTYVAFLNIHNNDNLRSVAGLSGIKSMHEALWIYNNDALRNLDGLENLYFIELLNITDNNALENIDGLSGLNVIQNRMTIENNPSLNSCCGLYAAFTKGRVPGPGHNIINNNGVDCTVENIRNKGPCLSAFEMNINCGGIRYIHPDGTEWISDEAFTSGETYVNTKEFNDTDNDQLYQSMRYGDMQYEIPLPAPGYYSIKLHFAEIFWGVVVEGGIGSRLFNVNIENGQGSLDDFDIYKQAGGSLSVTTESFTDIYIGDGALSIEFQTISDNASISGIEIGYGNSCRDLTLSSQAEVDAITCSSVSGYLIISGSDIVNLDSLSKLTSVPHILINDNPLLTDINGLRNITGLFELEIINNHSLENLNGLEGIKGLWNLCIINNDNLTDISGIASLEGATKLQIGGNDKLTNLNGLTGLKEIGNEKGEINIFDNSSLTDLGGLKSVKTNTYPSNVAVIIDNNDALESLDGLGSMNVSNLNILNNERLTSVTGLSLIRPVNLQIDNNDALRNLDGLEHIWGIDVISITDNQSLENIDGLTGLRTVRDKLTVENNPILNSCCGLFSLLSGNVPGPDDLIINNNGSDCTTDNILDNGPCVSAFALNINCGGENFIDHHGVEWVTDTGYATGDTFVTTKEITGTDNDLMYQSERYGNMQYEIPVPGYGRYWVKLHFAEILWGAEAEGGVGSSVFHVNIENGQDSLVNFDVYKSAGGALTAVAKSFGDILVEDGHLSIDFITVTDNAKISGIEIADGCNCEQYTLSSQAEVDAFNCNRVNGSLTISGDDISNLDNLTNLRYVNQLEIKDNGILESLSGLNNIHSLYGLYLWNNAILSNIDGLSQVNQVTRELTIRNNDNLENIDGLSSLKTAYRIYIDGNDKLNNISGLSGLKEMMFQGSISISSNQSLKSLKGLGTPEGIYGLGIYNNDALESLDGLPDYYELLHFSLAGNDALIDLEGLGYISTHYGFDIRNNDGLLSLDGLVGISPGQALIIDDNDLLENIDALSGLSGGCFSEMRHFQVSNNKRLNNCCGLWRFLSSNSSPYSSNLNENYTLGDAGIYNNGPDCNSAHILSSGPCEYGFSLHINCGGNAYDYFGTEWTEDQYFTSGTTYQDDIRILPGCGFNMKFYQSHRIGEMNYQIPVPDSGFYNLRLHFAPLYRNPPLFDVSVENEQAKLEDFNVDPWSFNQKIVRRLENINVEDGYLTISFTSTSDSAQVSGIEVIQPKDQIDNHRPVINNLPEKVSICSGASYLLELNACVEDLNDADSTLTWDVNEPNSIMVNLNRMTNELEIETIDNWSGSDTLYLTVFDRFGTYDEDTLLVNVASSTPLPGLISGNDTVCANSLEIYGITDIPSVTYKWEVTDGIISGNGSLIEVNWNTPGEQTITVTPSNSCGPGPSSELPVFVKTIPAQPESISGESSVCINDTQSYSTPPNPDVNYSWEATGGSVSGFGNTVEVTWDSIGDQFIKVTPSNSCGSGSVRGLLVTVNTVPSQPDLISGNTEVCSGNKEAYGTTRIEDVDYTWDVFDGEISGSGGSIEVIWESIGDQTLTVTPSNSCGSGPISELLVEVKTILTQTGLITGEINPIIDHTYDYEIDPIQEVETYNWMASEGYLEGNNHIVSVLWTVEGPQTLSVAAVNDCGESAPSVLNVNVVNAPTSTNNTEDETVNIYPNPSHRFINIEGLAPKSRISIYSSTGIELFFIETFKTEEMIDISGIQNGTYIVKVLSESEIYFIKLIKL